MSAAPGLAPTTHLAAAVACVRWCVLPSALGGHREATLTWTVDLDRGAATGCVEVDGACRLRRETAVRVERDGAGLTHAVAADASIVAAFRPDGTALYARTTLLGELGVAGGRYEVVGFGRDG